MTPTLEGFPIDAAALEARARRARAEAMANLFVQLLARLRWRSALKPDESLGRPGPLGRAQWG